MGASLQMSRRHFLGVRDLVQWASRGRYKVTSTMERNGAG